MLRLRRHRRPPRPQAVPPLAVSLIGEGANTVLSGIMRGCGRQRIGATVNLVRAPPPPPPTPPPPRRGRAVGPPALSASLSLSARSASASLVQPSGVAD